MSETRSQLEEIDQLLSARPHDPALQQLRNELLHLIFIEEQEASAAAAENSAEQTEKSAEFVDVTQTETAPLEASSQPHAEQAEQPTINDYTSRGTFTEHTVSKEPAVSEAPVGAFQPMVSFVAKKNSAQSAQVGSAGNLKDDIGESGAAVKICGACDDNVVVEEAGVSNMAVEIPTIDNGTIEISDNYTMQSSFTHVHYDLC